MQGTGAFGPNSELVGGTPCTEELENGILCPSKPQELMLAGPTVTPRFRCRKREGLLYSSNGQRPTSTISGPHSECVFDLRPTAQCYTGGVVSVSPNGVRSAWLANPWALISGYLHYLECMFIPVGYQVDMCCTSYTSSIPRYVS